ncbi:unnamed protein product [Caenorhabditis bovis]|uniref:Uncharacterized protein n=1 Tax=Caenorhabditis bovis TaxID=2654633 RepID=A0A8S1EKK4_9PELO|nr:unnamed protein product [Caenorhabditis bovis]
MSCVMLFALSCLIAAASASNCDSSQKPNTWANVAAEHVFFNAWQPSNDLPGFCVNNDFMTSMLNYSSHVSLKNSKAKKSQETITNKDIAKSNCGKSQKEVVWCVSHCQNKDLENTIISAAIVNGSLPLAIAEEVFLKIGSPKDVSIAAVQIDQSNPDVKVTYDYYDDFNFCSVNLKIKTSLAFPFTTLLTVQNVIV